MPTKKPAKKKSAQPQAKPVYVYNIRLTMSVPMPDECFDNLDELGALIQMSPMVTGAKVTAGKVEISKTRIKKKMAESESCPHCGADLEEDDGKILQCPQCDREGCSECMPAGRGCICPECEGC